MKTYLRKINRFIKNLLIKLRIKLRKLIKFIKSTFVEIIKTLKLILTPENISNVIKSTFEYFFSVFPKVLLSIFVDKLFLNPISLASFIKGG